MSDEIRRLSADEMDGDEGWIRETDEPDLRDLDAARDGDEWRVTVPLAEALGDEPLDAELREGMAVALTAVPGVAEVAEEDREVWLVFGEPSGEDLLRAAATVVDGLADRARDHLEG